MRVAIIGIGLIGGSMALGLKDKGVATRVIGVDNNPEHQKKALELGLVDEILPIEQAIQQSDIIIMAIPVNAAEKLVIPVLNLIERQVLMDVGSTKDTICAIARSHRHQKRFVATHPMWGTEYSGPEAAVRGAFVDKAAVICNKEDSDEDAVEAVEKVYRALGMHLLYMNSAEHDIHAAYVSHISHITSFALPSLKSIRALLSSRTFRSSAFS